LFNGINRYSGETGNGSAGFIDRGLCGKAARRPFFRHGRIKENVAGRAVIVIACGGGGSD